MTLGVKSLALVAAIAIGVAILEGVTYRIWVADYEARRQRTGDRASKIINALREQDRVYVRHTCLRWIFGDLGLAIFSDPDDIEPLLMDETTRFLWGEYEGEVKLVSPAVSPDTLPTTGSNLIVLANTKQGLYLRAFDEQGRCVLDAPGSSLTPLAPELTKLGKQLEGLWPPHVLTRDEEKDIYYAAREVAHRSRFHPDVPGRRLGPALARRVGKAILEDTSFEEADDFVPDGGFRKGFRVWRRGEHIDVWYVEGDSGHFDLFAVVTDWKGRVVHPIQHEHCVDSESLLPFLRELEAAKPTRTIRPEEVAPIPREG